MVDEQVFVTKGQIDSAVVVDAAAEPGDAATNPERTGPLVAFRSREFSVFFTAGFLSNTGTWMQTVTVPYVVDQLTHSTALVGVSAFAAFFPATVIGPLAGSLSDRHDRRTVLIWAQVVMMSMATALWITWATGTATTATILVFVVISALGAGITTAAWQSFVPQLVPRSDLLSAVRVNSMQFTAARAFGPALAGLVLATLGPSWAFGANAISFLCVIGALLVIAPRPPLNPSKEGRVLAHFWEGVRYVRGRAVLFIAVLMVMLIALFGVAIVQLIEPIARHVFHVGAGRYGLMTGAYGLGAVIGGVFTVAFGDTFRRSRLALLGLAMMAVGDVVLGVTPIYAVALVALVAMGLAQVLCMVTCNTAIQLNVDERYRGRASSMFTMSFFAAAPIGALIGGVIGDVTNLRVTIVGAGVILAICLALAAVRFHGLRPLDETPPISDETVRAVRELPPPSDVDSAAHLVVEQSTSRQ
jgi:MFS family permease